MSDKSSTGILPVLPIHRLEACATPFDEQSGLNDAGPETLPKWQLSVVLCRWLVVLENTDICIASAAKRL
jgi:hypothetical protein